jgi:hypothetical protein
VLGSISTGHFQTRPVACFDDSSTGTKSITNL